MTSMDMSFRVPFSVVTWEKNKNIIECFVLSCDVRQLYYTLPNCSCPDPFVTPDGYEKNGTVWQCARGYAGNPELLCQDPFHIISHHFTT